MVIGLLPAIANVLNNLSFMFECVWSLTCQPDVSSQSTASPVLVITRLYITEHQGRIMIRPRKMKQQWKKIIQGCCV